jgi:hypothetical protein
MPNAANAAMDPQLLNYYEAIERASAEMLNAARAGRWDEVVKLEGACVLLISQLKHAATEPQDAAPTAADEPVGARPARRRASSRASCSASSSTMPRSGTSPNPGCKSWTTRWPAVARRCTDPRPAKRHDWR